MFVKKEKYHEFQYSGAIANLFCNIIFKLKEYYITLDTVHIRGRETEEALQ